MFCPELKLPLQGSDMGLLLEDLGKLFYPFTPNSYKFIQYGNARREHVPGKLSKYSQRAANFRVL